MKKNKSIIRTILVQRFTDDDDSGYFKCKSIPAWGYICMRGLEEAWKEFGFEEIKVSRLDKIWFTLYNRPGVNRTQVLVEMEQDYPEDSPYPVLRTLAKTELINEEYMDRILKKYVGKKIFIGIHYQLREATEQ